MENLEYLLFITELEQDDVIVFTVGLEKTANCLGNNPFLVGLVVEHRFHFQKESAGFFSNTGILQDGGIPSTQFPGLEKKVVQAMKGLRLSTETGGNSSNGTLSPRSSFSRLFP